MRIGQCQKVDGLTLKKLDINLYQASWWDNGKNPRRRFDATSDREARLYISEIARMLRAGSSYHNPSKPHCGYSISDAVNLAILNSQASLPTKKTYIYNFNLFLKYLESESTGISSWRDINRSVIEQYIDWCYKRNLQYDTIRLRIYPLRMTSKHIAEISPNEYVNFSPQIRFKRSSPTLASQNQNRAILPIDKMVVFFDFLKGHDQTVYVWALLQGLCGLRTWEAAYLRAKDLNFDDKTIQITKNEAHTPKNLTSYRTLPIPEVVVAALQNYLQRLEDRNNLNFLFTPIRNQTARHSSLAQLGVYGPYGISQRWKRSLSAANALGLPAVFNGRKLRACFATMLANEASERDIQRYLGHAPRNTLDAHYDYASIERLRAISDKVQKLYLASTAKMLQDSHHSAA